MRNLCLSSLTLITSLAMGFCVPLMVNRSQAPLSPTGEVDKDHPLCAKIIQIKKFPLRRDDFTVEGFKQLGPIYGEFRKLGDDMVPCLIQKITDRTPMDDPRQAPRYGSVTVGDVAFWVFLDISGMEFKAALPVPVEKDYEDRGVYAYFDWVRKDPKNRRTLQKNVRMWYAQNAKKAQSSKGSKRHEHAHEPHLRVPQPQW